jgi:glycosyltransferase involved in cell wall biosynthesis
MERNVNLYRKELVLIVPVYNEAGAISKVLDKWIDKLNRLKINFEIHVYDGMSKDNTLEIVNNYSKKYRQIVVHSVAHIGHGPTILLGFRENKDAEWLFQIDSDDEMDVSAFDSLWNKGNEYDFLIGRRSGRKSSLSRKTVSFISRMVIRLFYGKGVWDVNAPYRLMRTEKFSPLFDIIPDSALAPNLIISGMACLKKFRILELSVPHQNRLTGVSINVWKLFKVAVKSFCQTIEFRFKL